MVTELSNFQNFEFAERQSRREELERKIAFPAHSWQEAEMVRVGFGERFFRASHTGHGDRVNAAENVVEIAKGYGSHAAILTATFRRAGSEADIDIIEPDKLKDPLTKVQVVQALVYHKLALEGCADYKWPQGSEKLEREVEVFNFLIDLSEDVLAPEVREALVLERTRAQYWLRISRTHDPLTVGNGNI